MFPDSGTLKDGCVNHLHFYINGVVQQPTVDLKCNNPSNNVVDIGTDSYIIYEKATLKAGFFYGCIYWTDGGSGCTPAQWLYSDNVPVN